MHILHKIRKLFLNKGKSEHIGSIILILVESRILKILRYKYFIKLYLKDNVKKCIFDLK